VEAITPPVYEKWMASIREEMSSMTKNNIWKYFIFHMDKNL
jgi:hypothetical protein